MDTDRELISAKANLSAAEKGGIEAINELKSTDKLISESLKAELDRLREDYSFVVSERDAQKSQLIEALLAKDRLRKEVEDAKELQENSTSGPADADMSEAMKKSSEKIEKLRTRLKERKQVSLVISAPDMHILGLPTGLGKLSLGRHQSKSLQTKQSNRVNLWAVSTSITCPDSRAWMIILAIGGQWWSNGRVSNVDHSKFRMWNDLATGFIHHEGR